MSESYHLFNRQRVRAHRDRAARGFADYDFLFRELASRMADRLPDIKRTFPVVLELGAHTGLLADYLHNAGIQTLIQSDLSCAQINNARGIRLVADEEFLPFAPASFDLVMSVFSLHWVNDLPGTLVQIFRCLKPGGLMLLMLPGGETLKELRDALEQAEMSVSGGISPRVSPFVDVRDAGNLLQRAGFILPVADSEMLTVSYEEPLKLLNDLRGMGEASSLAAARKTFTSRRMLLTALDYYQRHYMTEGRLPATFEVVTLTAWKPDAHSSQ